MGQTVASLDLIRKEVDYVDKFIRGNRNNLFGTVLSQADVKRFYGNKGGLRLCASYEASNNDKKSGGKYQKLANFVKTKYQALKIESVSSAIEKYSCNAAVDDLNEIKIVADKLLEIVPGLISMLAKFYATKEKIADLENQADNLRIAASSLSTIGAGLVIGGIFSAGALAAAGSAVNVVSGIVSIIAIVKDVQADKKMEEFLNSSKGKNLRQKINEILKISKLTSSTGEQLSYFSVNVGNYKNFVNSCASQANNYLKKEFNRKVKMIKNKKDYDSRLQMYKLLFTINIVLCGKNQSLIKSALGYYDKWVSLKVT